MTPAAKISDATFRKIYVLKGRIGVEAVFSYQGCSE